MAPYPLTRTPQGAQYASRELYLAARRSSAQQLHPTQPPRVRARALHVAAEGIENVHHPAVQPQDVAQRALDCGVGSLPPVAVDSGCELQCHGGHLGNLPGKHPTTHPSFEQPRPSGDHREVHGRRPLHPVRALHAKQPRHPVLLQANKGVRRERSLSLLLWRPIGIPPSNKGTTSPCSRGGSPPFLPAPTRRGLSTSKSPG